jgi:hypothetical protein
MTKSWFWAGLCAVGAAVLSGCPAPAPCLAGEVFVGGRCAIACSAGDPGCFLVDGSLVRVDASADVAMDSADGAIDSGEAGDAAVPLVCDGGATACMGACVDLRSSVDHCGACGARCPTATGERATCAMGACGVECLPGFERVGAACEVKVPRLLAPMSTSTVSSQRPTLRWEAPMGVDGGVVELCCARDCAMVVQRGTVTSGATSWRVETALRAGAYWWRVRGRAGAVDGARPSAVWEFFVSARDRATDTHWGTVLDVNGDGFADVAVGNLSSGMAGSTDRTGLVRVFHGSATGLPMTEDWSARGTVGAEAFGSAVTTAGDVNGDGYGDLVVGAIGAMGGAGAVSVYYGGAMGLSMMPTRVLGPSAGARLGAAVSAAGDVNGDGYGDVIVGAPGVSPGGRMGAGAVWILHGGAMGLSTMPARVIEGAIAGGALGTSVSGAIEAEGDRFADVVMGAPTAPDLMEGDGDNGYVWYFAGSAAGIAATRTREWRVPGYGVQLGYSVSRAGDVNGDGYGDLVIGGFDTRVHRDAYWVAGAAGMISAAPTRIVTGAMDDVSVGFSVAGGGDVNGDGFDDVFVAVQGTGSARADFFVGRAAGLGMRASSLALRAYAGGVGVLGDITRDGFAEVADSGYLSGAAPTATHVRVWSGGASPDWTGMPLAQLGGPIFR